MACEWGDGDAGFGAGEEGCEDAGGPGAGGDYEAGAWYWVYIVSICAIGRCTFVWGESYARFGTRRRRLVVSVHDLVRRRSLESHPLLVQVDVWLRPLP